MTIDAFVVFIHVIAGVVLAGGSLLAPLIRRAMANAGSLSVLRSLASVDRQAGSINPAAAMLLLATGIYLGSGGWWYAGWFYLSLVVWAVNSALAALVVKRTASRLMGIVSAADGDAIPPEADALRRSRAWGAAESVIAANNVAVLYVMVAKPELLPSCAVVMAANAIALAATTLAAARSPETRGVVARY